MADQNKQTCATVDTPTSVLRDLAQYYGAPLEPLSGIDTNSCRLASAKQVAKDLGTLLENLNYSKNIVSVFGLDDSYPFQTLRSVDKLNSFRSKLESAKLPEREKLAIKYFFLGDAISHAEVGKLFANREAVTGLRNLGLVEEVSGKSGESRIRMRDVNIMSVRGLGGEPIYILADSPAVIRRNGSPKAPIYSSAEFLLSATRDFVSANNLAGKTIVDFGSGTGVQGIAIAKAFPNVDKIHLVDIEPRAMRFSLFNGAMNGVSDKLGIVDNSYPERDPLGAALKGKKIDLMVSNPPYNLVPAKFESEFTKFGYGGPDGTKLARMFVNQARPHLAKTGTILMTGEFAYSGDLSNPTWKMLEKLNHGQANNILFTDVRRFGWSDGANRGEYAKFFVTLNEQLAGSYGTAYAPRFNMNPDKVAEYVQQDLLSNGIDGVAPAVIEMSLTPKAKLDLESLKALTPQPGGVFIKVDFGGVMKGLSQVSAGERLTTDDSGLLDKPEFREALEKIVGKDELQKFLKQQARKPAPKMREE